MSTTTINRLARKTAVMKYTIRQMKYIIRERLVLGVVHMASVVEAIVFFATLGFWSIHLRGAVLFSDWAENFTERKLK